MPWEKLWFTAFFHLFQIEAATRQDEKRHIMPSLRIDDSSNSLSAFYQQTSFLLFNLIYFFAYERRTREEGVCCCCLLRLPVVWAREAVAIKNGRGSFFFFFFFKFQMPSKQWAKFKAVKATFAVVVVHYSLCSGLQKKIIRKTFFQLKSVLLSSDSISKFHHL